MKKRYGSILVIVFIFCVSERIFASDPCTSPCFGPNDPSLVFQGGDPCQRLSYHKLNEVKYWKSSFAPSLVEGANLILGYFNKGRINDMEQNHYHCNAEWCCDVSGDYKVGVRDIAYVHTVGSGGYQGTAIDKSFGGFLSPVLGSILSGLANAYPQSVLNTINDYLNTAIANATIATVKVTLHDDDTEDFRKDECAGCPNVESVWTGILETRVYATGSTISVPSHSVGPYQTPSIEITFLQGKYLWSKKGRYSLGRNTIRVTEVGDLLLYSYKIGSSPPQGKTIRKRPPF